MKHTKKQLEDLTLYKLTTSIEYHQAVIEELGRASRRTERYGRSRPSDSEKNMVKALRMMPWKNTPEDWARLHVTEYLLNH